MEGSERENGGQLSSMDSESRWVFQDDEDDEEASAIGYGEGDDENDDADGLLSPRNGTMDSDDDDNDNAEQRLIRTGPRIDSFDVEALEVPGAHRNDFEVFRFNFFF